jgi:hypothetical protein
MSPLGDIQEEWSWFIRHRTSDFTGVLHSGTNDWLKTAVLVPRSEANRETPSTQRKKTTAKILKGRKEKGKAVKNESALRGGQAGNFLRKCAKRLVILFCVFAKYGSSR